MKTTTILAAVRVCALAFITSIACAAEPFQMSQPTMDLVPTGER